MHEVVRYCYEYQLLMTEAQEGQLTQGQRDRLQALSRLLATPEEGKRSHDRVALRCAGTFELASGPEPVCVVDIGAGGLSVVVPPALGVATGDSPTIVISDVKRGTDYSFPCTVTRIDPDPDGRRVGLCFAGRPTLARRGEVSGRRDDDSLPRIDLKTLRPLRQSGLADVLTPPEGTPQAHPPSPTGTSSSATPPLPPDARRGR